MSGISNDKLNLNRNLSRSRSSMSHMSPSPSNSDDAINAKLSAQDQQSINNQFVAHTEKLI